jgi:UDP-GlcNAc3NAcA epimerase
MRIAAFTAEHLDFLQMALVCQELRQRHEVFLIYPGRSQDFHATRAFVAHLALPEPDIKLDIPTSAYQFALEQLLIRLDKVLAERRPDMVLIGDGTTIALAATLAAAHWHIPVVRFEAGRRFFDKFAPGGINYLVSDRLADQLFCGTQAALARLAREGIVAGVHLSGAVQADAVRRYYQLALRQSSILSRIGLPPHVYLVALIEHLQLVGGAGKMHDVVGALNAIREPIVLASFEDTPSALGVCDLTTTAHVLPISLVEYVDWLTLAGNARAIITDSSEVQREAYLLGVPCITLSDETEMPETQIAGWNKLVGTHPDRIIAAVRDFVPPLERPPVFGDGYAIERIGEVLATQSAEFGSNYTRVVTDLLPQAHAMWYDNPNVSPQTSCPAGRPKG